YAWKRRATGSGVQLYQPGRADCRRSCAAVDSGDGGSRAAGVVGAFRGLVCAAGAAVDSAGEAAAGAVAADSVLRPQRAATDGAARLQPAVPLVRGIEPGRRGLGCDGIHEKPGAAAARRDRAALARSGAGAGTRTQSAERRTLHGGRNADRGVGEPAEFRAQESAADGGHGRGWQETAARHARVDDGSGGAAVQEEHGGRGEAELSGASDHREPEGAGGGGLRHAVQCDGGAGSGVADAGGNGPQRGWGEFANPRHYAGSGHAVSRTEVYRGVAAAQSRAACGRVRTEPALAELADGRRTARSRLRHQSEETQADRESVWLGQAG